MSGTVVILVNGEVLANSQGSKISDQRDNAEVLARSLYSILASDVKIALLHGNKPQVGYVLLRSELASHILHGIPLDVCGADTQGATGYLLSQAITNVLNHHKCHRRVMSLITQTLVNVAHPSDQVPLKTIGPWYDREKAEQFRQARGWQMVEEPGRGYRRAVPSYPPLEILEIDGIRQQVEQGDIVIAAGGGGIPVFRNTQGELQGVESVINTDDVGCMIAKQLNAQVLLMVIEKDHKFILSGLSTESKNHLTLEELDKILKQGNFPSSTVQSKLDAAARFLHQGGEQVVITTLRKLPETLEKTSGLRIGSLTPSVDNFNLEIQ